MSNRFVVDTRKVLQGCTGRLWCTYPKMVQHWHECVELRQQSLADWVSNFSSGILELPYRFEISVTDKEKDEWAAVGVVAPEYDVHVGLVLAVQVSYKYSTEVSVGAFRTLFREYKRLAEEHGIKTLKVPKRLRDWEYKVLYIKI